MTTVQINDAIGTYAFHGSRDALCFCPEEHPAYNSYLSNLYNMANISLDNENYYSDFQKGFYLGDNCQAAREWASRYTKDLRTQVFNVPPPEQVTVNIFDVDVPKLCSLNGHCFPFQMKQRKDVLKH